ncbi:MAG: class I SAM-dependent methyltransferase [bacterium]|nr:class I SAM-dependent methyltransferase [bacterium]
MRWIRCPVCGADNRTVLIRGCDRLHHLPGEFTLVRCACDTVYINPQPEPYELATYYPESYLAHRATAWRSPLRRHRRWKEYLLRWYYGYPLGGSPPPRWARALLRPFLRLPAKGTLKSVLPYHGEGRLLDVGCGNGRWLRTMQAFGWRVQGVEVNPAAARTANELGVPVFCGTLVDAHFPAASFDVVRLHYVFEHLTNPGETLAEISRILAPRGLCYIRIPNIRSWTWRWFGTYWFPLDVPRHVIHYSPRSFARLASAHGLRVRRITFRSPLAGFFTSLEFMRAAGVLPRWLRPLRGDRALWRNVWRPCSWLIDRLHRGDMVTYELEHSASEPPRC